MRSTQATAPADARDARMLAMADRLFHEFDQLPVRTVFQAIAAARVELREAGALVPGAADIEVLARQRLLAETWRG